MTEIISNSNSVETNNSTNYQDNDKKVEDDKKNKRKFDKNPINK